VTALGGALWSWRSVTREAELAALKINLVSRVSHELKTPLALIRMYGETLGMGRARDSQQAQQFGGIISRESERLTILIQRILDFSRQQAGTLQYSPQTIELGPLLRSVCDAYTPHLEASGAILVETLPPDIFVHCDANACESAIVNLLENAAKYAREGDREHEIELDLFARADLAVIEVRDHGRGIPPAELDRVFEGFYRASNAGEVRGAGLGLSLVHHFVTSHGGNITAYAREGGGTVFRLTLPRVIAPDRPAVSASAERPRTEGTPTQST
jgi:signal transduction histidine kinase